MRYERVCEGRFLERPNRFIAHVDVGGIRAVAHVKNTGRCRELLLPGSTVWLQDWGEDHPGRKTRYDLITVKKGSLLVNMDAQAPNRVFEEWARSDKFVPELTLLRPEVRWRNSRFDFYWETGMRKGFVEVKGVTLEEDGRASFPDAPTQRGVKHLEELIEARREGYEATICFVIQMEGMKSFEPNDRTHPAFGDALRAAAAEGVTVLAWGCQVEPDGLIPAEPVPVLL